MKDLKLIQVSIVGMRRMVDLSRYMIREDEDRIVLLCKINRNGCVKYTILECFYKSHTSSNDLFEELNLRVISPFHLRRGKAISLSTGRLIELFDIKNPKKINSDNFFVGNSSYYTINMLMQKLHVASGANEAYKDLSEAEHYRNNLMGDEQEFLIKEVAKNLFINEIDEDSLECEISKSFKVDIISHFKRNETATETELIFIPFTKEYMRQRLRKLGNE